MPQLLRERGYSTAAVVSASLLRKETGINQGFDFFDDEMPLNPEEPAAVAGHRDGSESEKIAEHWLDSAGTSRTFLGAVPSGPHGEDLIVGENWWRGNIWVARPPRSSDKNAEPGPPR